VRQSRSARHEPSPARSSRLAFRRPSAGARAALRAPATNGRANGAKLGEVGREGTLKAVKELILNGYVLATQAQCVTCDRVVLVTRLRRNSWDDPADS